MQACRVCCSASRSAASDSRVKHGRLGISRGSNSLLRGPLLKHRARSRLVAKASGGSSDVDEDEEAPGAGTQQQQQQQQQQGNASVDELLDDFFTYFNSTFPDTIGPLLTKEDLGSRRALLGHIVTARRKVDKIRKAGKDTLSFGDSIYVSFIFNILKLVNAVLEKEIELTVELEQELGSGAKEDPAAEKQWVQEKEPEAARAGAMEFQTEDELIQALSNNESIDGFEEEGGRSAEGAGDYSQLRIWGTATVAMLFAAGVTWSADQLNLDVAAHLGVPEDPASFLRDTLLWTLPLAAVSVPFWRYILSSETVAGEVFRNGLTDKDDALEMLGAAEIWGISALLETGAGLLFRGTILSAVTLAVAGIPSMVQQEAPDLYVASVPDIAVHFPTLWMWPFVAVATGAVEASLVQTSLGGFKEHTSLDYLEEEASVAMLKAMTMTDLDLFANSQEGSQQQQQQQAPPLPSASTWNEGEDAPIFQIALGELSQEPLLASGDVPLFVKKLPLSSILNFLDTYDVTLRTSGPSLLYMPMLYLVKGTLLSAEAILTGNVWSSIITGTVLTSIEETAAKHYLEGLMQERRRQQEEQL